MAVSWNYMAFSLLISYSLLFQKKSFGNHWKVSFDFSTLKTILFFPTINDVVKCVKWDFLIDFQTRLINLPIVVTAVNEKNKELKKSQDGIIDGVSSVNVSFNIFIKSSNKSIWSSWSESLNFAIFHVRFWRLFFNRRWSLAAFSF